ncbi:hypothetical protein PGB28_00520 [Primorskyibacter aestuariivivens]|uniref:hypothetical protein n=1 Tax=Primorskyibacter aestuariivivens TaxID=1888912 RepID=UPI0023001C1C|nr:hypothetical protein [Primorskyibacter aestuariivivens]MDA7426922.1 hypothetical protein [Primorskyibacter aestuariivivens]
MSSIFLSLPRLTRRALAAAGGVVLATALAAEPVEQHNSNAVWFENWTGLSNAQLVVAAPDGEITTVEASSGTPLYTLPQRDVQDGIYRYELTAATDEKVRVVNTTSNGRDTTPTMEPKPFVMNGHFVVDRGVIIAEVAVSED